MFYALGSIGSFADGARTRQKEQRVERAAIRDEFERWKANNPNATAMDFHAKVKQLGATTPGGSVALPDASSIQRMAAENLRRKQEEEADRARKLRVDNLNMSRTESAFLTDQIDSGVDVDEALRKAGMELSPENFALAKGIKAKLDAELEQAKIGREFNRSLQVLNAEQAYLKSRPFASPAEAQQAIAQRLGVGTQTSQAPNPSGATTRGASLSDNGVLHVQGAFDRMLPTLFENNQMKYAGPNGYETLKRDALQLATSGGSALPPEQIIRALEGTNFMTQFNAQIDDLAFKSQLEGKQPSELSITVGDGKNAMAIELAEIYKSQLNNSNILSSRRIPYNKLDEFQSIVAPYFEVVDGAAKMKTLLPSEMEQVLAQVEEQLNTAGIYNQDQLAMKRQQKIAEYGQVDSLDILLADQKAQLDEVVEEAAALMKSAGSVAEQSAVLANVAQRFDYFKGMIEGDRIADIYANGGVHPLDILPTNQHALFQKDAFYALFDDAMAELNQIAAANKAQVEDPTETAEATRMAREEDIVQKNLQAEVTEEEKAAVVSFAAGMDAPADPSIIRVVDGQVQRVPFLQDGPVAEVLKSKQGNAFINALRAGLEVYRDDTSGQAPMQAGNILVAAGKSAGRFLSSNAFEGARQGRARDRFEDALIREGFSAEQADKLADLFQREILNNPTEYETGETQNLFGGPATVPVTKLAVDLLTDILLAPPGPKPMTSEQMLQQSVPGAQFVVPN